MFESASPRMTVVAAFLLEGSCSSRPPAEPVDIAGLEPALALRGVEVPPLEEVRRLAQWTPLALEGLLEAERFDAELHLDRDSAWFWHVAALAFAPSVQAARHGFLAAAKGERAAGAFQPAQLEVDNVDFLGAERETEVTLSFELLSLFGAGRAGAEREFAKAETRAALGSFESEVWASRFRVDRARVRLAAARARRGALQELQQVAEQDRRRIDLLGESGRLAPALHDRTLGALHELNHHRSDADVEIAKARADLGMECGLVPDHPALDQVTPRTLERMLAEARVETTLPDAAALARVHPAARAALLDYALSEAELRAAAAHANPEIRLGPQGVFSADPFLWGGLLEVDFPFPSAVQPRIDAALERRRAAHDVVEATVLQLLTDIRRSRTERDLLLERHDQHLVHSNTAMERMWKATRAEFAVDVGALDRWVFNLDERIHPLLTVIEGQEDAVLAWLDLLETSGPRATDRPGRESAQE